jgi:hypothetical protein
MLYSFPVRGDSANEAQPPPDWDPISVVVILLPLTWIAHSSSATRFGPPNV